MSSLALGATSSSVDGQNTMSYSQIMNEKISKMLKEAECLYNERKFSQAVAKLTRAISLQPSNPQLFHKRAETLFSLGEYEKAIANFDQVVSLQGEDPALFARLGEAHWLYGESLYMEKKYPQALEIYETAAQYNLEGHKVTMRRVSCLLSLERYNECIEMIKQELESDDSNPELYILRAKLEVFFGDPSAAYYDVCKVLELDPTHKIALDMKTKMEESALQLKNQAIHQSLVGRKMDAVKKITSAIETDPAVAAYHILRGALYRRLKDFEAAVDDFLMAMEKVDHDQENDVYRNASRQLILTYNDFAMECFRQRHFSEAVTLLNKAIKEEKAEKGLYLNRGDCFYRLNNLHFALSDYQQALELDPANWDVSCRIGIVCCELGIECYSTQRYSEAEKHFTAAIRHNPKVSRFYVCRAKARFAKQSVVGPKDDILAALLLDPTNEECISLIARAFPGKTKDDLLHSKEAELRKQILKTEIQKLAPKTQPHSDPDHFSTKTLKQLMEEVGLKFEGSDNAATASKESVATDTSEQLSTDHEKHPVPEDAERESELPPKNWSVLTAPLPVLTVDPQGVMPVLTDCLQEHSFHKKIYYSKKMLLSK